MASIETGHKVFNAQQNYIGKGNVSANTQFSSYIRPKGNLECNGFSFKPGELQSSDITPFRKMNLPINVEHAAKSYNESVILYTFFHTNPRRAGRPAHRVIHGYVLTSKDHFLLAKFYTGPTSKSAAIIDTVIPAITA